MPPQVERFHSLITASSEHLLCSQPLPALSMSLSLSLSLPRAQGKAGPLKVFHSQLVLWWTGSFSPGASASQLALPPGLREATLLQEAEKG